jgi:ABC-type multidrug transport system ATPase subunit
MKLEIRGVGKQYDAKLWALRGLSLELAPGVLGLLGPNGAGKSTLMRILATLSNPTEGQVFWNGADIARQPEALRRTLGYLPQDFGVYPNLNAVEFLEYLAAVKGIPAASARRRIDELLALVNLTDARKRPLGGFSGGMRQRVGIAQALLNDPKLLIVDEPTAGLDPVERVRFRNLLSELSGERIVILSTHIVSDVAATATDIAIVSRGRLVAHAAPEALLAALAGLGAGVRALLAGDVAHLFAWAAGAMFIPALALALALGVWSGTSKLFEGLYTALWYAGPAQPTPGLDFIGAPRRTWMFACPAITSW